MKAIGWCFALVNDRLAEVFFEQKGGAAKIVGHCYVKYGDYKTKKEQKMIADDTKKYRLTYKNRVFSNKLPSTG